MKEVLFLTSCFISPKTYATDDRGVFDDETADRVIAAGRARFIAVVEPPAATPKPASNGRLIRVKVRPHSRSSTRKLGNQILEGGEEAEVEPAEALELLVAGDVEASARASS